MIVKATDIEINKEVLEDSLRFERVKVEKAINSPKYTIIDWAGFPLDKFKELLETLDDEDFHEYFNFGKNVNNKEILLASYKKFDSESEEVLWNQLVDCRVISDGLYQKQTYEENFDLLFKMMEFILPLEK